MTRERRPSVTSRASRWCLALPPSLPHLLTLSRQREHEKKAAAAANPITGGGGPDTGDLYSDTDGEAATGRVEKFEEEDGTAGLHCSGFSSRKEERANMSTKINTYLLMPAESGCD